MNKEIEIPDGYEARIECNKVILEPIDEDAETKRLIRVAINNWFNSDGMVYEKESVEETKSRCLAYLEKQKEQKPLSTEETELNSLAFLEQIGYTCIPPGKEQGPVKTIPIFRVGDVIERKDGQGAHLEIICIPGNFYSCKKLIHSEEDVSVCEIPFKNQDLFQLSSCFIQKPAEWSEEDKMHLNNAILAAENVWGIDNYTAKFLKSLRPQPKQSVAIGFMIYLDEHRPEGKACLSNAECNQISTAFKNQDWGTIIKYIEKYQPHWKPSEEQMKCLEDCVNKAREIHNASTSGYDTYHILSSLYSALLSL